jgi:hypothetical protein
MALAVQINPAESLAVPSHSTLRYNPYGTALTRRLTFPDGRYFVVGRTGFGALYDKHHKLLQSRLIPADALPQDLPGTASYNEEMTILSHILARPQSRTPFAADHIVVVFNDGVAPARDTIVITNSTLATLRKTPRAAMATVAPMYTNDSRINAAFASLGVSKEQRLFTSLSRSQLSMMHSMAQAHIGRASLNIANAYRLNLSGASVLAAVRAIRTQSGIAYVSPDWTVSTMNPIPRTLPEVERRELRQSDVSRMRSAMRAQSGSVASMDASVPGNFAVASSLQSLLNSSNLDVMAAYREIEQQFHQLPGTGETITNVSIGDLYSTEDGNGTATASNRCPLYVQVVGPTTHTIGGQRYLDWPGMPLIPAYAADANGHTDPSYVACEGDPIDEIGLDFSMMAPLPDNTQRPGEQGTEALGDLLGIAPGANYRLFVPATNAGSSGNFLSVIDGVFLAAASLMPKTNIITASLGEGFDGQGFPGRYLEDDPLTESVISTIVNSSNIVVCISANDGMREYTATSIGPSGGSAATNVTADPTQMTNLNDIPYSTIPSIDVDSGAIDVGGSTLNDIFAHPMTDPASAPFMSTLAYPETRYDGGQNLSSGFGTRVNISAPADNVIALSKTGLAFDAVDAFNTGGTSASAPEVAAAAAVAMQVARLTGHAFTSAADVRKFLVSTATPVTQTPQTDQVLNVGPQLNLRKTVEQLFANASIHLNPSVSRVATFQRKSVEAITGNHLHGAAFFTNTDPTAINLAGTDYGDGRGPDGTGSTDPITIAPDWEGMPQNASYSLFVTGHPKKVLASTPFARFMPQTILTAAGLSLVSSSTRTVHLTYRASSGLHTLAQTSFDLTFGPSDGTSAEGLPPIAPPVVTGQSFQVSYNISKTRYMTGSPMLVVTEPGRFAASSPYVEHLIYSQPLSTTSGTVTVPVSALQGGGLYGVGVMAIDPVSGWQYVTDFTTVRVQQVSAFRPKAPVVQVVGGDQTWAHILEFPFASTLNIKWDVSGVPNAYSALLEVSAPGPTLAPLFNTFNNPNGSIPDNDGIVTGSVKVIPLSGVSGTRSFKASDLGLNDAMMQQIRVIPVNGQGAVGEASDVSSLIPDGVRGAIGGWLDNTSGAHGGGFGINPNGNDAFVADVLVGPGALFDASIDLFDQSSLQSTSAASLGAPGPWGLLGGGYYANSTAFFAENAYPNDALHAQYDTISTTQQGLQYGSQVTLPSANDEILQTSYNPESSKMAYLYFDSSQPFGTAVPKLRTYDFSSNTFGPELATPLDATYLGVANGYYLFNADMGLGKAVIGREAFTDFTGYTPSYIDIIDLQTGSVQEYPSQASGIVSGMAIDTTTHMAMTGSAADDAVVIINLQTGAQQKIPLKYPPSYANGGYGVWDANLIAADPVNHLFLAYAIWGPGIEAADFNATSPIYVFNESGNLVKTITGWAWATPGDVIDTAHAYLQVNGNTRKAYLMMGQEIGVINY